MTTQIKFGTSGWRAVMAEEFTFANVRRAVGGIARYVAAQKKQGARVIVGRDPRFLGETFCAIAAEILEAHGIMPVVVPEPAPTPAFAYAVVQTKADGVINFTASHNPPEYNGIKFSTPDGCPALPEVTNKIEAEIEAGDAPDSTSNGAGNGGGAAARESLDVKPGYL
jgi:phosphoglucomutase